MAPGGRPVRYARIIVGLTAEIDFSSAIPRLGDGCDGVSDLVHFDGSRIAS